MIMKKIICLILILLSTTANAKNSSYCINISNNDLRNFCYALTSNGSCTMINDNDMRNFCYALK